MLLILPFSTLLAVIAIAVDTLIQNRMSDQYIKRLKAEWSHEMIKVVNLIFADKPKEIDDNGKAI